MDEFPFANLIFIILTIAALSMGLFLAMEIMYPQQHIEKDYQYYEDRQEIANAFHNLAKAYNDCSVEENCMCDVYKLRFPDNYAIKAENQGRNLKLTLLENNKPMLSETITGMATGIMQSKTDRECRSEEGFVIRADKKEWYATEGDNLERHYLMDSIEEIYKPKDGTACIVPESLMLNGDETMQSLEDYFGNLPRCTFKQKKKEEQALSSFKTFIEEFNECSMKASEGVCGCGFSRISLPEGYSIIKSKEEESVFILGKKKNSGAVEILKMKTEALPLMENANLPEFTDSDICIISNSGETGIYSKCRNGIKANAKAVFFENGAKAGFLTSDSGIIRIGDARLNRASIEPCTLQKSYEFIWPVEKLNNVNYIGECFGSGDSECNKGIAIPQNSGNPVFAAEDGTIEYTTGNTIRIKHRGGIRTQYENVEPMQEIEIQKTVFKGQQIGIIQKGKSSLLYSLTEKPANAELFEEEKICKEHENKVEAIAVFRYGMNYLNPSCYFSANVRNSIVYPAKCETPFKGCDVYGNEETPKYDIRLKVLVIPVNRERQLSYTVYSNEALDKFLAAIPLNDCPYRFKKTFVDGKTDYGEHWSAGSCSVQGTNNCLKDALASIKTCAEEYKARTGEDYDYVVGVEDSDIASQPECIFADKGWTSENSDAAIVEASNAGDMIHELGHKFGLRDQYCDCSNTNAAELCGYTASPNPLRKELGCGDKCCVASEQLHPYLEECKWCSGNLDINARDLNNDKMLDSGKRTAMSNLIDANSFSIDEYLLLKANSKMQCM
ncbi:MAG: M23 family metallopeptidase [Nanoarchaeota archaeon]